MHPHLNIFQTPMANKVGNSQVLCEKSDCGYVNRRRSRPFYQRRCKPSLINLDSFPDDLVFEILLHLLAQDIHDAAQLVCKKWYKMVHTRNFVYKHLHQYSTPGLLVHCYRPPVHAAFVAMRRGKIEISKFSYNFKEEVYGGCNGFILDFDVYNPYILHVANPITKQRYLVPQPFDRESFNDSCIAYAAASNEYKLVHRYIYNIDYYGNPVKRRWAILTVGVDNSWRQVDTSHIFVTPKEPYHKNLFATEGFVHWPENNTCVLSLNVETEIITQNPVPDGYSEDQCKWFLSMGRSLSMFVACGRFLFDVWEMKSETGEWTKLYNIDLEAHEPGFEPLSEDDTLVPAGWLKYDEVLVVHVSYPSRICMAYNVRTQEVDFFEFDFDCVRSFVKQSLISY